MALGISRAFTRRGLTTIICDMGLTYRNIAEFCENVRLDEIPAIVDLSEITFFRSFAIIYLMMFLRYHSDNGIVFKVKPPLDRKAYEYLIQQSFWLRANIKPDTEGLGDWYQSKSVWLNETSFNDIVVINNRPGIEVEIAESAAFILKRQGFGNVSTIETMIGELVDNFRKHSKSKFAAAIMQCYPNKGYMTFALGDYGRGIRSTLSENPQYSYLSAMPHSESAKRAFDISVSCRSEGGMGLTDVKDNALSLGGNIKLTTGDGYVDFYQNSEGFGNTGYNLPGVQIEFQASIE